MSNATVSPTRRAVLRTITTVIVLVVSAMAAGCGTSTKLTPGGAARSCSKCWSAAP